MPTRKQIFLLLPVFGIILYVLLYFIATLFYPGGSQADKNSVGFSWVNNYWCNLLYDKAINGKPNPAQPTALTAMAVLCVTLIIFWYQFPIQVRLNSRLRLATQISGALSMAVAFLLFTNFNHDLIINTASAFGLIATTGTFIGLWRKKWLGLFYFGLFNLLLVGLNNLLYYTIGLNAQLPLVQKITFLFFLVWFCCITIQVFIMSEKPK